MNKLERIYKMIDDTSIGEYEKDINFFDLKPIGCIKDKEQHLEMDLFHYEKENLTILDQYDGNNNIYTSWKGLHDPSQFIYYLSTKNIEVYHN